MPPFRVVAFLCVVNRAASNGAHAIHALQFVAPPWLSDNLKSYTKHGNAHMRLAILVATMAAFCATAPKAAVFTPYSIQAAFEAALDVSFTRIDYDAADFFVPLAPGVPVSPNDPRFLPFGVEVITGGGGFTTQLVSASVYPAAIGGATWAQLNGNGTSSTTDDFAVNFIGGVNGFGFAPNRIDGGVINYYSGEDLSGVLLGTAINSGFGNFVGATSDTLIRSAQITCEFDGDFVCGITDPQFGRTGIVPLPGTLAFFGVGLASLLIGTRRVGNLGSESEGSPQKRDQ